MSLPQEIIDKVIDELSTEKTDLTRVAPTARCFLHRTQFHLFRSIDLDPSHSQCVIQNAHDWDTFDNILLSSPSIKFYVREIFINNIFYEPRFLDRCSAGHIKNSKLDFHIVTLEKQKQLCEGIIARMATIFSKLPHLEAVRLNDRRKPFEVERDWRCIVADNGGQNVLSFCISATLTTLALCHLKNVPVEILDSILLLSQLTILILNGVYIDSDSTTNDVFDNNALWRKHPKKSYLTNLEIFGFVQENHDYHIIKVGGSHLMTKIAVTIVHAASQTLRQLRWCDKLGGPVDIRPLENLKVFSTSMSGNLYEFTLRPVLHDIIASHSPTIEVLELFEMENIIYRMNLDVAKNYWTELGELLDDGSFSHLKEIRLLFEAFATDRDLAFHSSSENGFQGFTTEEAGSLFKSKVPKASAEGVRFSFGFRDSLLP